MLAAAVPVSVESPQALVALLNRHGGLPLQQLAGAALIEPVCRRELLGEELRHGRLIAGRHVLRQTLPHALDYAPGQGLNLRRHREARGGNADRLAETAE